MLFVVVVCNGGVPMPFAVEIAVFHCCFRLRLWFAIAIAVRNRRFRLSFAIAVRDGDGDCRLRCRLPLLLSFVVAVIDSVLTLFLCSSLFLYLA